MARKSKGPRQRYRDAEHRQRVLARRRQLEVERYWEDLDYRQKKLETNRAYRAAHGAEINGRRRERLETDPEYRERVRASSARNGRKRQLKKYGISVEDYDAMLMQQGGVCRICKRQSRRRLIVDHCHKTDKVRGLLCLKCNSALGFYGDDPRLTRAATAHLEAALGDGPEADSEP